MSFESAEATTRHAVPLPLERRLMAVAGRASGVVLLAGFIAVWLSLMTWSVADPSLTHATSGTPRNIMGALGAIVSDLLLQTFGLAAVAVLASLLFLGVELVRSGTAAHLRARTFLIPVSAFLAAGAMSALPVASGWPLHHDYGGIVGDTVFALGAKVFGFVNATRGGTAAGLVLTAAAAVTFLRSLGLSWAELSGAFRDWATATASVHAPHFDAVQPDTGAEPMQMPGRTEPRWDFADPLPMPPPIVSAPLPRFIDRGGDATQAGFADGFARAIVSVRNVARRGVQVVHEQKAKVAESLARHAAASHAAQPAAPSHPNYGQPYAAAGGLAPGQAGGYYGVPHGMQASQRPPHDPGARQGANYVPPHPPAYDYRAPSRGPAAQYAPHPSRDPFDMTTEEASRAIARRFAPAQTAYDYDAYPAAAAVAPPAHVAAPVYAGQPLPQAAPAPATSMPPVSPPAARPPQPVAPAAAPAASAPQGTRRNALFGGLTFRHQGGPAFKAPPLSLLKKAVPSKTGPEFTQTVLRGNARLLEDVLADFGVKGEVRDIRPGPVVTLFEMEPARGTKSSRVIGLADDIARSMSATAVRVAVVPGRNAIGIELPNAHRETVLLRELLEADAFKTADAALPMAIGKSIGGEPVVADLARMPHLLVAGTTGSGKSVGVNAMILSLLYRLSPDDCRFLMIDPKMLELSVYNGIPHLLTPVVTDPQKAVAALNWVVGEMEERYKRMSKLSVRNIDVYNNRVRNAKKRGEMIARTVQTGFDRRTGEAIYEQESLALEPMPYIVVVIDEFADLMMVAGKEVEASVQRLAQMARAAGIHLIMATQRPSVDVITGTIKANFPTRISFKVTSKIDSRTILNEQGAEQLLGQGDMLFTGGGGQIARVHGAFVSDEEVEAIAGHLRQQGQPQYVEGITDMPEPAAQETAGEDRGHSEQDLYDRAVAVVLRDRKASTSYIQRRLSIGYNRAADLIERMEREGVVGPANNVGKRDILGAAGASEMPERDADAA